MEYSLIPTHQLNRLMRIMDKLEPLIQVQEEWVDAATAMKLIGCKKSKLSMLVKDGKIIYKTSGGGRNIRYSKSSIDEFNEANSSRY